MVIQNNSFVDTTWTCPVVTHQLCVARVRQKNASSNDVGVQFPSNSPFVPTAQQGRDKSQQICESEC
jgi:hypothetical protein